MGTKWTEEAEKRLERVPQGFMRNMTRSRVEKAAKERSVDTITLEFAEEVIGEAKKAMMGFGAMMGKGAQESEKKVEPPFRPETEIKWSPDAAERIKRVPEGFMREMTKARIEETARKKGLGTITVDMMEEKYGYWAEGSRKVQRKFKWEKEAEEKLHRIPEFIRGMVVKEVEALAEKKGLDDVTLSFLEESKTMWGQTHKFHADQEEK